MNAKTYIDAGMEERFFAWYRQDWITEWFSDTDEVEAIKSELLNLPWLTKRTARHEYLMAEKTMDYSYGNIGLGAETYQSQPFSPLVKLIMERLNSEFKTSFNACFLNKYDNEQQHLGWHADDFVGMRQDQPIGVVSFGAEREIWVKPKPQTGVVPANQKIKLHEGSLFMMPTGYQDVFFHRIPKHDRPCGWRISLTFRRFN